MIFKNLYCPLPSLILFVLLIRNEVNSFNIVTPRLDLPESPVCAPNAVPSFTLSDEYYSTCANQVKASENVTNPDKGKTTEEIARYYGYPIEIHTVTTKDGYILTLHRITGSPASPQLNNATQQKPSVYIHHGMGGSSDNWLFQPGDRNIVFKLADAGYDIWLANCRGTTYSLGHVNLNSSTDTSYWDFSWHEMAMYDVPASIDLITSVSGNEKILYIGYSMGTTAYFITLSEMPEYNDKIIAGFMLAPSAFDGHSTNPSRLLAPLAYHGKYLLDPILRGRIEQPYQLQRLFNVSLLGDFCTPTAVRCGVCDNAIFSAFGFDAPQMNYTNLPNILPKLANIISVKTLVHYAQSMSTCRFRQFDYGPVENAERYNGSSTPPAYNLSKITAPTYFFHGESDNFACPEDVQVTRSHMLPTTVLENIRVDWDLFNHLDFVMAKDADVLLYNKVLELMNGYI